MTGSAKFSFVLVSKSLGAESIFFLLEYQHVKNLP